MYLYMYDTHTHTHTHILRYTFIEGTVRGTRGGKDTPKDNEACQQIDGSRWMNFQQSRIAVLFKIKMYDCRMRERSNCDVMIPILTRAGLDEN